VAEPIQPLTEESVKPETLTVGEMKTWARKHGYMEHQLKELFSERFGSGQRGEAAWESDSVSMKLLPAKGALKDLAPGRVTVDPGEMKRRVIAEREGRGEDITEALRHMPSEAVPFYKRQFPERTKAIEEAGGFVPLEGIRTMYEKLPSAMTQKNYREAQARRAKTRETRKWKTREEIGEIAKLRHWWREDLRKRQEHELAEELGPIGNSIVDMSTTLGSELQGMAEGVTTGIIETIDYAFDIKNKYTKASYARPMSVEQLGEFAQRAEFAFGGVDKMPQYLKDAIRSGKMRISKSPKLYGDYGRGEERIREKMALVEADFAEINKLDRNIISNAVYDTGDIIKGLLHLALGPTGYNDSDHVKDLRRQQKWGQYDKDRTAERTEFYRGLVHTVTGAVVVLLREDEGGDFIDKFQARPGSTWMTVQPVLRLIKSGLIGPAANTKAGRLARAKAGQVLDRWEGMLKSRLGEERAAQFVNAVDAGIHPLRSAKAFTKSFVVDRAVQAVPRATELMRKLFAQPIKTRAVEGAAKRKQRLAWQEMEQWLKEQDKGARLPDGSLELSEAQWVEWARLQDKIMEPIPKEQRKAFIKSVHEDMGIKPRKRPDDVVDEAAAAPVAEDVVTVEVATAAEPSAAAAAQVAERLRKGETLSINEHQYRVNHSGSVEDALMSGATPREPVFAGAGVEPEFGAVGAFESFVQTGPPIAKVYVRPRKKGEKSATVKVDQERSLVDVFEARTERAIDRYRPYVERWDPSELMRPAAYRKALQGDIRRVLDDPLAKLPVDFIEPVLHVPPSVVKTGLDYGAALLPKFSAADWARTGKSRPLRRSLGRTAEAYSSYRSLDPQLLKILEYGMTGHRAPKGKGPLQTFRSLPGGFKLNYWVHPAVEQALYALHKFMTKEKSSLGDLAKIKNLGKRRARFNKKMKKFGKSFTWDRSGLPESVNAMLNEILQVRHVTHKRQAGKAKLLREHAPVESFAAWADEYWPGVEYDAIPVTNTNKFSAEVLADPAANLVQWLKARTNRPGIVEFLAQRGAGPRPKGYGSWVKDPWKPEAHTQLLNFARWGDEGPRTTKGERVAYQPIPAGTARSYPDKRIYGRDFQPYLSKKPTAEVPPPRTYLETEVSPPEAAGKLHRRVMEDAMAEGRKRSAQEAMDLEKLHGVQREMARLMREPEGADKAAALFAEQFEKTYLERQKNQHREVLDKELAYARTTLDKGADAMKIDELPGALPMAPDQYLAAFSPKTAQGRLWKDMATRRLHKGIFNGGYVKVGKDMMKSLNLSGEVYMPRSAIRQWRWQKGAMDATYHKRGPWAKFATYVKANLTALNLPTLLYNTLSNVGMEVLTQGPDFFVDYAKYNLQYRQFLKGKKFDPEMEAIFGTIEESGLLSTDFHRMELQFLAEGIPDFRKQAEKLRGPKDYLADVLLLRPLSKLYGGVDNTFKLYEAVINMKKGRVMLGSLKKPGQFIAFPVAQGKHIKFTTGTVRGKKRFYVDGKMLSSKKDMWKALSQYGSLLADLKFFDYSNLPGWNAALKGRQLDMVFSPFLSFTSKAMWIPGFKRGLAREIISEMPVKTNIPGLIIKTGQDRLATWGIWSAAIAQQRQDFVEGARDLETSVRFNPLSGHMMMTNWVKDPGTVWVKDLRALDFLEPTLIFTQLIDDLFGLGTPHMKVFGEKDGPMQMEFLPSGRPRSDVQHAYLEGEWKHVVDEFPFSGASMDDILNQMGLADGPLIDALHELKRINSTWWGHREFTPRSGYQTLLPPLLPGTWGKAIDVSAGLVNADSPLTSRTQAREMTEGQVPESEADFARRRLTGVGMISRPVKSTLDRFFNNMKREWKARVVGTPGTHGSLKWKKDRAIERGDVERARALDRTIKTRNQLINWSIQNRRAKAEDTMKHFVKMGVLQKYGTKKEHAKR
jgi:hypothetical protein